MPNAAYASDDYSTDSPSWSQQQRNDTLMRILGPALEDQVAGIRLLYPGLRHLQSNDLQQATVAHYQELSRRLAGHHTGDSFTHPRPMPDSDEILRYRSTHLDTYWMSDGGIAAAIIFEWERARSLARFCCPFRIHGAWAQAISTPADEGLVNIISPESPAEIFEVEPSEGELADFRAQCESTARLSKKHLSSIIIYLRQRQRRRRAQQLNAIRSALANAANTSVSEHTIKGRIQELRNSYGSNTIPSAHLHRIDELQVLLACGRSIRLQSGHGFASMVDRAVQTIAAVPANRNSVLRQPSGLAVPDMEEPESPERETDNDTEMELDDGSSYSDGTVEDEMYHDLFEEFHSALL